MFRLLICVLGLSIALLNRSSVGQESSGGAPKTQTYLAGELYLPGSRIYVHVFKTGLGHEHAIIGLLQSGQLALDSSTPPNVGLGELTFDIKSFLADTETARKYIGLPGSTDESTQRQVTQNMLSADVLDAASFPTAKFVAKSIRRLEQTDAKGLPQYQIQGDFTLHGTSRPLTFVATAEDQGELWTRLKGSFEILQTDYGIRPYRKAFGAVGVADKLTIYGDLILAKREMVVPVP